MCVCVCVCVFVGIRVRASRDDYCSSKELAALTLLRSSREREILFMRSSLLILCRLMGRRITGVRCSRWASSSDSNSARNLGCSLACSFTLWSGSENCRLTSRPRFLSTDLDCHGSLDLWPG